MTNWVVTTGISVFVRLSKLLLQEYISKSCDKISIICCVHFYHSRKGIVRKRKLQAFHIHKLLSHGICQYREKS